ncbi:SnoaL-like domain-containing protein [Streptomyces sp. RPA4-5]|uniref:YybH family protein n=1 Tax=Streptomyces TaxID=1883 RepID=UPI00143E4B31|nr:MULTISPECIES: nuclear transport factor 2 family protein [Streptomyces]MCX4638181.1 nuclear transport factor 2 family protein [Streptomyces platensis]QIY54605.1 SnoaL-like domain-containing protein [Streptomyces sp. RPA4-5]WJY37247.1 nuclear transport factor 2 family protein [Streptomyces sp. P9-2B-2]
MTTDIDRMTDEAQIRELLADRAAATKERDARRFLATSAPDLVDFSLAPPLQYKGPEARDQRAVEAWYATWDGPIEVTVTQLEITVGDDVAFGHSINRMRGTKTDGFEVELWSRATVGLRRIDGTWKITHTHDSVPFLMDGSGLAALDLQP